MTNLTKGNKGKGSELVVRIRKNIMRSFDIVEEEAKITETKGISGILADAFRANPLKFLDSASKFTPKDINAEIVNTIDVSKLNDSELAEIVLATQAKLAKNKEPIEHATIQ